MFAQRFVLKPGNHPDHIHGCRRQKLLEVCARQAKIPTLAKIKASDPLRQATLHPDSQSIPGFELRRLLALPGGLERLMKDLWADHREEIHALLAQQGLAVVNETSLSRFYIVTTIPMLAAVIIAAAAHPKARSRRELTRAPMTSALLVSRTTRTINGGASTPLSTAE